ncbi:MAG TPA: NrfD/PsrC family molybdoenzyme membrane anchor subunit, partial [Micromonosporaceae bacterium]
LGVVGSVVAPAIALVFTAATGVLLVWDLKQPKRFLFIFTKPNFRSWLVLGAIALSVYSAIAAAWLVFGALREASAISSGAFDTAMTVLSAIAIPAAAATAGYTGFLFGQAEGRDLWQSPLLFWHLLVQAAMVGGGALVVALPFVDLPATGDSYLIHVLVVATVAHLVVVLLELGGRHATRGAAVAAHMITRGRYAPLFWTAGIGLAAVAVGIGAFSWQATAADAAVAAAVLVQAAILAYESCFVRAGQDVPLS